LQAYRFIAEHPRSGDVERLDNLEDPYRLFRCHTIMNCVDACPKNLNPTRAINKIKELPRQARGMMNSIDKNRLKWKCRRAARARSGFLRGT